MLKRPITHRALLTPFPPCLRNPHRASFSCEKRHGLFLFESLIPALASCFNKKPQDKNAGSQGAYHIPDPIKSLHYIFRHTPKEEVFRNLGENKKENQATQPNQ